MARKSSKPQPPKKGRRVAEEEEEEEEEEEDSDEIVDIEEEEEERAPKSRLKRSQPSKNKSQVKSKSSQKADTLAAAKKRRTDGDNAPKGGKKKQKNAIAAGEEDDAQEGKKESISPEEMEKLTADVMRLFICKSYHNYPLKRSEIVTEVMESYKGRRNLTTEVINNATNKMKFVFGFEVKELAKTDKDGKEIGRNSGIYVLKNCLQHPNKSEVLKFKKEFPHQGLLTLVLSLIFIQNRAIEEEELFNSLTQLKINAESGNEAFGTDTESIIKTEFVKQMYVTRQKAENQKWQYILGPRTYLEIPLINLYLFICHVHGQEPEKTRISELLQELKADDENDSEEEEEEEEEEE